MVYRTRNWKQFRRKLSAKR